MAFSAYEFSTPKTGVQPYVHPGPLPSRKPPVAIPLDEVFAAPPTTALPKVGPFSVVRAQPPFDYRVEVEAAAIWEFDGSPIRPAVRSAFDAFLEALDAIGLQGGRLHQIRGWLAQALPQTFAESLYFRYGFDPTRRCVELSPGMRLRIDFQAHQTVDPASTPLNGFVGAGSAYVGIGQAGTASGGLVLAFDPFLSQLQGLSVGASPGAGGAIDLAAPALQMPYWRLHYPALYPAAGSTGYDGTQQNPALVGAPTRAALEAASKSYEQDGTVPSPAVGVWFRGRSTPVPEIPFLSGGEPQWCALGTTLRGLVAGFAPAPWIAGTMSPPTQFCFRLLTPLVESGGGIGWTLLGPRVEVALNSAPYRYGPTLDPLDLPIVGGDSIYFPSTG